MEETATFIKMMNKFLDCLNVEDFNSGKFSRNLFKSPYRSGSDFRLKVYSMCDGSTMDITATVAIISMVVLTSFI